MMPVSFAGFIRGPGHDIRWHPGRRRAAHPPHRAARREGRVPERARHLRQGFAFSTTLTRAGWSTTVVSDVVVDQIPALEGSTSAPSSSAAAWRRSPRPVSPISRRLEETRTFTDGVVLLRHQRLHPHASDAGCARAA